MKISGSKLYTVKYLRHVHKKDIPALPENIRTKIKKLIRERLALDPINLGEPLRHSLKGHRRLRFSRYRIVYRVNKSEHSMTITEIGHRSTVYDHH